MYGQNPIRKQELGPGTHLAVQETFSTVQGEGPSAGVPAYFIRLHGCNLACFFCDTDFESNRRMMSVMKLVQLALQDANTRPFQAGQRRGLVVITGGEPFRQNLFNLVRRLLDVSLDVEIETAGTLWVEGLEAIQREFPSQGVTVNGAHFRIICSPKTPKLNKMLSHHVDYYKYIIRAGDVNPQDGLPCRSTQEEGRYVTIARPPDFFPRDRIYVQPCDEYDSKKNTANLRATQEVALKHGYRISVQVHKLLGLP